MRMFLKEILFLEKHLKGAFLDHLKYKGIIFCFFLTNTNVDTKQTSHLGLLINAFIFMCSEYNILYMKIMKNKELRELFDVRAIITGHF